MPAPQLLQPAPQRPQVAGAPQPVPSQTPQPSSQGPGKVQQFMQRVFEIIKPYVTTGYAGQAEQALQKHNKELELLLNEDPMAESQDPNAQYLEDVAME